MEAAPHRMVYHTRLMEEGEFRRMVVRPRLDHTGASCQQGLHYKAPAYRRAGR